MRDGLGSWVQLGGHQSMADALIMADVPTCRWRGVTLALHIDHRLLLLPVKATGISESRVPLGSPDFNIIMILDRFPRRDTCGHAVRARRSSIFFAGFFSMMFK